MPLFIFFSPSPKIHVSFHCVQSVSVAVAWVSLETAAGQTMIGCVVSLIAVFQAVGPLSAALKQVNRGLSKGFALVVWKKPHRWHLGECVTQGHWFEENRRQQGMKKRSQMRGGWQDGWDGGVWLQWKLPWSCLSQKGQLTAGCCGGLDHEPLSYWDCNALFPVWFYQFTENILRHMDILILS